MHANKREEIKEVYAGDIAAAVGLKTVTTGDTICDEKKPVVLESMDFPEPVISLAIEPKTKADQEKLGVGLQKLMAEDPTFRVKTDQQTGEVVIAGMGELHLEIIVDRLKREFNVEASVGRPQVAYKETLTRPADGEMKYAKQTGGRGQYGHAKIHLFPGEPGTGYVFENKISGGSIPKEFIKPVDEGIKEALTRGVLAGYPIDDVRIELYDGSYHDVDSSEMAFKIAGSMAFQDAAKKAKPVLLEPVMRVEVVVPKEHLGDVMGNLSSRRGHIQSQEDRGGTQIINARVPLSEMFGYATDLRSRTQGRATYSMHFDRYEQAPSHVSEEVVAGPGKRSSPRQLDPNDVRLRRGSENGYTIQRQDPHPPEGVRQPGAGSVDDGDRGHGAAHRRAAGRPDSAADREEQVDGAALAARRQEVARAVRAAHAQAADRHLRADAADGGRADEARSAGRCRRRDQGVRERTQVNRDSGLGARSSAVRSVRAPEVPSPRTPRISQCLQESSAEKSA